MIKANIFDIQRASFVDGPGIRTTVFFKGCNLRCAWCHNPESQSRKTQMLFYKNRCTNCGKCKDKCPNSLKKCDLCGKCALYCPHDAREICGKEYTVDEIFEIIKKDISFYESSGGGVTFSGGECMLQIDFLCGILKKCKEAGIHTAVDTAGHIPYEYFKRVMPYTDLFLYDVKCVDSEKHRKHTGVGNELILSNLARLLDSHARVIIRVPVIAGVNDSEEEIRKIKKICTGAEKIELLPYHAMGEHKYEALGRETPEFFSPSEDKINVLQKML